MEDQTTATKEWKQKVHAVDMALRTVQQAASEANKSRGLRITLSKPRLPFTRVLPSRS